jgi:uncharacterized membrane protein (UPF0127 family)
MEKQTEICPAIYSVFNQNRGRNLATRVSIAGTSRSRRQGLLGKERIEPEAGLWIAPCEAIHTFGMRTAIDVIFLDRHSRVSKLVSNLKPRRIALCLQAASVLELGSGNIAQSETRVGDQLQFQPSNR